MFHSEQYDLIVKIIWIRIRKGSQYDSNVYQSGEANSAKCFFWLGFIFIY